jgi:hypothetical protein
VTSKALRTVFVPCRAVPKINATCRLRRFIWDEHPRGPWGLGPGRTPSSRSRQVQYAGQGEGRREGGGEREWEWEWEWEWDADHETSLVSSIPFQSSPVQSSFTKPTANVLHNTKDSQYNRRQLVADQNRFDCCYC